MRMVNSSGSMTGLFLSRLLRILSKTINITRLSFLMLMLDELTFDQLLPANEM